MDADRVVQERRGRRLREFERRFAIGCAFRLFPDPDGDAEQALEQVVDGAVDRTGSRRFG
jgi:hypothetical protein